MRAAFAMVTVWTGSLSRPTMGLARAVPPTRRRTARMRAMEGIVKECGSEGEWVGCGGRGGRRGKERMKKAEGVPPNLYLSASVCAVLGLLTF
ncbi:hypothetical protein B0H11DRAFT_2085651 [Mycena galericulata]|nr:hypothetical protein B0H11DRAFT_2085651 [Mycena galericulata]